MPAGQWGGIQQVVEGLARGLSAIDEDDEFIFIGYDDAASWLDPLLNGPCRRVEVARSFGRSRRRRLYDALAARAPAVASLAGSMGGRFGRVATPIPRSDGSLESLGVDAVHFVTPQAFLTAVPSVYQLLDLLHEHLPGFFSPLHRRYRDAAYRAFADQAQVISTMTVWTRSDITRRLRQPESKIAVVPLPPAVTPETVTPEEPHGVVAPWTGTAPFILYPAQTWPHKNHLLLIEALASLRDAGVPIGLVATGRQTGDYPAIKRRIHELKLEDRVEFLGYVQQSELAWLYQRSSALVFPSQFEGWGIPIVEAFAWNLPVACSNIPVLDEVARDAAVRFDPNSSSDIAAAIRRVVEDADLRSALVMAGERRLEGLTWDITARTFRALYRRVAEHPLTMEDERLLAPPTFAR